VKIIKNKIDVVQLKVKLEKFLNRKYVEKRKVTGKVKLKPESFNKIKSKEEITEFVPLTEEDIISQ
jgi:hypothetical protein